VIPVFYRQLLERGPPAVTDLAAARTNQPSGVDKYSASLQHHRAISELCIFRATETLHAHATGIKEGRENEKRIPELETLLSSLRGMQIDQDHPELYKAAQDVLLRARIFEARAISKQIIKLSKRINNLTG
jgi:hypothetical protein